ncbi:gluconate 2-dehydrogenase subunit 3 family protein [Flexithrix dorotheae]|uniref:gluconate 2-dehydrogenase subunit 3 family protein n=1 Tax=Flexithrix dorotheae TaxID=70993 RepID=UPI0003653F93|nr:gluconate 2-dehydrogenase subunit 3 family protein [Flexithrix dorotheae]
MNRRDALSRVSMILGGSIIGAEIFLYGCKEGTPQLSNIEFTANNISFLDEVGDTILPNTASSPGAKAAKIGEFMKVIVTDCYEEKDQKIFLEGISKLNDFAKENGGDDFLSFTPEKKKEVLEKLDKEAGEYSKNKKPEDPNHYFRMIKELTLWGYFSSEIGATQALRYVETPGRYDPCMPYKKGDKAWAI